MSAVVVATPDVVGSRMAGPGIRAFHLARELSRHAPTTLVGRLEQYEGDPSIEAVRAGTPEARDAIRRAEVVVGQPSRELLASVGGGRRIYDLFDPVVLELPMLAPRRSRVVSTIHLRREWGRLFSALRSGDLLIAATPAQRDFYTGVHFATGGNPEGWEERWIEVPFGVEPDVSELDAEVMDDDRPMILWGGGAWPWLDPGTAVDAVRLLADRGTRCRLVFLGTTRPNAGVAFVGKSNDLEAKIRDAGDLVQWNEGWVPYADRARWLKATRVALMLHHMTPEAAYSIRTRFFDALWCGVPVVTTEGGFVADLVARESLGAVVGASDVEGVAAALERIVSDDGIHDAAVGNLERVRPRFHWDRVAAPLVDAVLRWVK